MRAPSGTERQAHSGTERQARSGTERQAMALPGDVRARQLSLSPYVTTPIVLPPCYAIARHARPPIVLARCYAMSDDVDLISQILPFMCPRSVCCGWSSRGRWGGGGGCLS
eukprot:148310-Rhodomonas_salina.8